MSERKAAGEPEEGSWRRAAGGGQLEEGSWKRAAGEPEGSWRSRTAAGGIAIQWRSSVEEDNSDIL